MTKLRLDTSDNNRRVEVSEDQRKALELLTDVSLSDLCKRNERLLVFPPPDKGYGDEVDSLRLFTRNGDGTLATSNLMGFVGTGDISVRIRSRFATGGKDYLLHYLLQRVLAVNVYDLKHQSASEEALDFLIYLFPQYLKAAWRQGIFKQYRTRQYNEPNMRGALDVARHLRLNVPFQGNVAYTKREYSYDNRVTQLIRHTIEYIATHRFSGGILQSDKDTAEAVAQFRQMTPGYSKQARRNVISQNLRPLAHPYFSRYAALQRLCLQILRHEELKYGNRPDEIYGVLFDGAWLWEEYLAKLLGKVGFAHAQNKLRKGGKKLFHEGGIIYPDFYNAGCVADAKYKRFEFDEEFKAVRADIYQLVTYLHCMERQHAALLYPTDAAQVKVRTRTLTGAGGTMRWVGVPIANEALYEDFAKFCAQQRRHESAFSDLFRGS